MTTLEKYIYPALEEIGQKKAPDTPLLAGSSIDSVALVNLLMFVQESMEEDGIKVDWSTDKAFGSKSPFLTASSLAEFIDEQLG